MVADGRAESPKWGTGDGQVSQRFVELTGESLTVEEVVAVARDHARVTISGEALQRVRLARDVVEAVLASGQSVYGLNTGLGSFYRYRIPSDQLGRFSFATVADQTSSYGRPLPVDVVRDDGDASQRHGQGRRRRSS